MLDRTSPSESRPTSPKLAANGVPLGRYGSYAPRNKSPLPPANEINRKPSHRDWRPKATIDNDDLMRDNVQMEHATSNQRLLGALTFAAVIGLSTPAFAAGTFDGFAGTWSGRGYLVLTDGSREPIRCKASYAVPQVDALHVAMVCASDSYKVNLTSSVVAEGNAFSGSWQEETKQLEGDVTGRIPTRGTMQASMHTLGGDIELSSRISGSQMAIAIVSQGSDFQGMNIQLRRN